MSDIELSAVMGTYNRLHILKKVLPVILSSGAKLQMEIIINDGGSTDGTPEWLKEMGAKDDRIVLILNNKPEGITTAYNQCFAKARGTYLTWLSDDTIPVGDSLFKMCQLMRTLKPGDLAAFPFKNGPNASYRVVKVRGFYCPEVSCIHTATLREMNYWNTDYPHYGQDNEFDARILRRGGNIVVCNEAKIDHLNHQDEIKKVNLKKYSAQGHGQKFQIIYFNRYGIRSKYEYPVFGVAALAGVSQEVVKNTLLNIRKHYKNLNLHVFGAEQTNGLAGDLDFIKIVPWIPKLQWSNEFDLVVLLRPGSKSLLTVEGKEITRPFVKELLG